MTKQTDLKNTVEAASKGKQTVLFTATGQPTFVNVINKTDITAADDLLLAAIGITGDHPAFKIGGATKDKIYVSTYPSQLVNGELLSLPFVAGTGIKNISSNSTGMPAYLAATGLNAHVATVSELNLLKTIARKSGFNPYGNDNMRGRSEVDLTQFGIRVDGLTIGSTNTTTVTSIGAQLSGSLKTGSGPSSFRIGSNPFGISDLGYYFAQPVYGVRIIKGEVQVYANPMQTNTADASPLKNIVTSLCDSLNANFSPNWFAIDATSGGLITPTYSGALLVGEGSNADTKNYVVTTPNSVKLTIEVAPNIPAGYYSIAQLATNGSLPAKVVAILKYIGLITDNSPQVTPNPAKRGGINLAANGISFASWGSGGIFETRIDGFVTVSNPRVFYYD